MKPAAITNLIIFVMIAVLGYATTTYFETRTPKNVIIQQPTAPIETFESGTPLPDFTFTTPNGKSFANTDFKGKVIILNFWASWCAPCIKEFPNFIKASEEYPDKIIFIGLSSDIDETAITTFAEKFNLPDSDNFLIALDNENLTPNLFNTHLLPETIIIDQNQIMRTKIIGADWTYEDLKTEIEALLQ